MCLSDGQSPHLLNRAEIQTHASSTKSFQRVFQQKTLGGFFISILLKGSKLTGGVCNPVVEHLPQDREVKGSNLTGRWAFSSLTFQHYKLSRRAFFDCEKCIPS